MGWSNKACIDCDAVKDCLDLNHYNTVESCVSVSGITDETFNVYKVITRNESGFYTGIDHYEWFDHSVVDENTYPVSELGPCNCCDSICAKPFELARRCFLYTNLGSTYTFGPGGILQDPSIWDDPCPGGVGPCAGFDFACTNAYPIQVEFFDSAYSTDSGATWTHFSPATITYNSTADVTYSDAGYGLGWDGIANAITPFIRPIGVKLQPNSGNNGVWEFSQGVDESNTLITTHWRWVATGGMCSGVDGLDPYEQAWFSESQVTSTLGQVYGNGDGLAPISFNVETTNVADFTAPIDSCANV